jgi:hypothetical protein
MKRITLLFAALAAALVLPLAFSAPAQAQATRTWVSGVGDDVNPCSRTAPCKTFAGAISKTAASGEINCIDPGGFGVVTITKSITIDCGGTFGSILAAGSNGVIVNAAGIKVILRNLSIDGAGTGVNGVNYIQGAEVTVEKCSIFGFTNNGVNMALTATSGNLYVIDTNFNLAGRGVRVSTTSGFAVGQIQNASFKGLSINAAESGPNGILSVNNSSFALNATAVNSNGTGATINVTNSILTNNTTAFNAGAGTIMRISGNKIFDNPTGFVGTIQSGADNKTAGNGGAGAPGGGVTTQ